MKKLVFFFVAIFVAPIFVQAESKDWDIDYCNKNTIFVNRSTIHACHIVKPGETLWSIAETYYGSGWQWKKLQYWSEFMRPVKYPDNPKRLVAGSKLVVWLHWEVGSQENSVAGWGINNKTHEIYTTREPQSIYVNDKPYDGPFYWLRFFTLDHRTNNKIYVADTKGRENSGCFTNSMITPGQKNSEIGYQVIFNKIRNPYYSCGWDFAFLTFSPDGKYYAIRNNTDQDSEEMKFIVLSNMGNGPLYDFSDSLIWYDNNTLIYRAQNNDEWRVVVNHKDYKIFNYLENLRLESGVIKFDARHDDGSWSKEEITL